MTQIEIANQLILQEKQLGYVKLGLKFNNSPLNFRREFKMPLKLMGKYNRSLKYNKLKISKLNNKIQHNKIG